MTTAACARALPVPQQLIGSRGAKAARASPGARSALGGGEEGWSEDEDEGDEK